MIKREVKNSAVIATITVIDVEPVSFFNGTLLGTTLSPGFRVFLRVSFERLEIYLTTLPDSIVLLRAIFLSFPL